MKKSTFTILGLVTLVVLLTSGVKNNLSHTSNNGITGQTTAGCTCHGTQQGTVTQNGIPTTVLFNTSYPFTLTFTPGGSYKYWGLDVKASVGTLTAGTGMKKSGSEVTHSSPLGGTTATSYTYTGLQWKAPATAGAATITFACVGGSSTGTTSGPWQKGSFATTVVLPVEFSSFSVVKVPNNKVSIDWKTATEINSSYFEIEKSVDAKNYTTIAKVAAAGNATNKSYSVTDVLDNANTVIYYRIKTVDNNGSFGYSSIQSVNSKTATTLNSVYPNPIKKGQDVNVELTSEKEQTISFVLVNMQGRIISSKQKTVTKGYNRISLQFGNYIVAGNYYLQAKVDNNLLSPVKIAVVE